MMNWLRALGRRLRGAPRLAVSRPLRIESLEDRLAPTSSPTFANASYGPLIGLDGVRAAYPFKGDGYSVAVLDTGIDYNHPALGGGWGKRVIAGYDFVNNDPDPMDDNGHGTHVAGIIGSSSTQYPGIAPDVNLIALKVLDANADGSWTTIDEGLKWVIAHEAQYNIIAVNLSLGSGNYTTLPTVVLDSDLATLKNDGLFLSVASGNGYATFGGQQGLAYPAVNPNVVSVGAVWDGSFPQQTWSSGAIDYTSAPDQVVSITQRSSGLDLLAPGAWINSTWNDGGYATLGGTSMAAGVVTGAAVLLHQALDAQGQHARTDEMDMLHIFQQTGVPVADNAKTATNEPTTGLVFPRLDLLAALNAVVHPPTLAPIADQSLPLGGTLAVPLVATAPANLPVTYSVSVISTTSTAYQLKQSLGLTYAGSYYLNLQGANEKWLTSTNGTWYCLLPSGELRRWSGTMAATLQPAAIVGTLDNSDYQDPSKLWNASPLTTAPVSLSVNGNQLTIHATSPFIGSFIVQVTVSDGMLSTSRAFLVNEKNNPPALAAISTQTVTHGHPAVVTLNGSDPDNQVLQYAAQVVGAAPAALAVNGNQLTITTPPSYVGSFTVQATVTDGSATAVRTFTVNVTDTPPTLATIPVQTLALGQTSLTATLPGSDADGDALSYSAQVLTPDAGLYQLNQKLHLHLYNGSYQTNLTGMNEKWLVGADGTWYGLLPNGNLYRWAGSAAATFQPASLIASLGPTVYTEPRLLWQAQPPQPPAITLSAQGGRLIVQRPVGLVGVFFVQVTVSDGVSSATQTFELVLN